MCRQVATRSPHTITASTPHIVERTTASRVAPPSSEGGDLTLRLVANASITSFEVAAPALARRTSWGCQHSHSSHLMRFPTPLLVAPYGADNALARRASILGGLTTILPTTRPSLANGGLASRLAADNSSTSRFEVTTPSPAHRATSREELDVRQKSYDADGVIVRLRRVNGDVECDAATSLFSECRLKMADLCSS